MKQQINLYQAPLRREKKPFAAKTLLWSVAAVLAGTAGLAGFAAWQLHTLQERSHAVAVQVGDSQLQLTALAAQLAARQPDPALAEQVNKLEQIIIHRQQLRTVLQGDLFQRGEGYSRYLVALARQHVRGMWLTSVTISGAGNGFTLQGATLAPDLVPQYLQNLSRESLLQGQEFRSFQLKQPVNDENKPARGPMGFMIATTFAEGS